jgi:hypothetical protein
MSVIKGKSDQKAKLRPKKYRGTLKLETRILVKDGHILLPEGEDLLLQKTREANR